MSITEQVSGDFLVITPQTPLVAGGESERLEQRLQERLAQGHRLLAVDLKHVEHIDSTGVRALVRGYTTAKNVGGVLKVVAPQPRVAKILHVTRLDAVFDIHDTLESAIGGGPRP